MTTPTNFTGLTEDDAYVLLWMALEAKGLDYVYPKHGSQCVYYEGDEPSCLIGHVLAYLGFKGEDIEGNNARTVLERYFPDTSNDVMEALNEAQRVQDTGGTWGDAYKAFENWLNESKPAA